MAGADIPERDGQGEKDDGDDRNKRSILRRDAAAEKPHAGIEGSETEGNHPAEKELNGAAVNRKRPAAESDEVPDRRMHADAVLPEEGEGAENREDGNVYDARAEAIEGEPGNFGKSPVNAEAVSCPGHAEKPGGDFVERLNAEVLEEHLEQRGDGAQKNAVEFSLNDVVVAEIVEIEADDVEQAVGDERKAPEKENFFEAPSSQLRGPAEEHDHEGQGKGRGGKAGGEADEEIAAIADADFGVLREIIEQEESVAAKAAKKRGGRILRKRRNFELFFSRSHFSRRGW